MAHGGATVAEDPSYLRGGLALMCLIDEIEESDAHGGSLGRGEVGAITAIVRPAFLGGVSDGAVKFDAEPIGLVKVVQVPVATAVPDPGLPLACGQPVRALHAADVSAFEPRQHAFAGIVKRCVDLGTHGESLAGL